MTIHDLDVMPADQLKETLYKCCGSTEWVNKIMSLLPYEELVELLDMAEKFWYECTEADWKEAFSQHPKIGDANDLKERFSSTTEWAPGEQARVQHASAKELDELAEANKAYEKKFGYIFIISATGKSTAEMLQSLRERLGNSPEEEIKIAAEEQNKITLLRLQKLFQ